MAVQSFTCLLQVGVAPIRRGGSRSTGLGFQLVNCAPHFVRRELGSYGWAWLRGVHLEGSRSAIPLAHFCPQGSPYLEMLKPTALSRCESAHARWRAWRQGGSAA